MCWFHKYKLDDIVYEEFSPRDGNLYGVKTIEIYKCIKCGKLKFKTINKRTGSWSSSHYEFIERLKSKGAKDIIEYKLKNVIDKYK